MFAQGAEDGGGAEAELQSKIEKRKKNFLYRKNGILRK